MNDLLDFTAARKQLPPSEYRQYLKDVDLSSLTLEVVEAKVNRSIFADATSIALNIERQFQSSTEISNQRDLYVDYVLHGLVDAEQAFWIHASYRMRLHAQVEVPEAFYAIYAHTSADTHVWPYLRELADGLTGKMGLPRLTLPLLKNPSLLNSKRANQETEASETASTTQSS